MSEFDFSFCPQCGHKLEKVEAHCPFCGYRLAEEGEEKQEFQFEISEEEYFCPTCNTRIPDGEKFCSNCGMWFDKGSQQNENVSKTISFGDDDLDDKSPVAEIPVNKKVIDFSMLPDKTDEGTEDETMEVISEEVELPPSGFNDYPPADDNKTPLVRKKRKGLIITIGAVGVLLIAIVMLFVGQAAGWFNVPVMQSWFGSSATEKQNEFAATTYYYCYATATVNKKMTVIVSNVFSQSQKGNTVSSAEKIFSENIKSKYPKEATLFVPIVVRKFSTLNEATADWGRERDQFRSKAFTFRDVEIQNQ